MTTLNEKLIIQLAADVSDLKRGMNEAAQAVEKPGKAGKKAAAELDTANKSVLKTALDVKRSYTQIAGLIALVGAAVGVATLPFIKYHDAVKRLEHVAGTATKPLANINERIKEIAASTGKFSGDIAASMAKAIGSFGGNAEKAASGLEAAAKAAFLGTMSEEEALAALAPIAKAYHVTADDIKATMAVINKAVEKGAGDPAELASGLVSLARDSEKSKVPLTQLASAMVTMTEGGASTAQALGVIQVALRNSLAPTEDVKAAAEAMGLNWSEGAIDGSSFAGVMTLLANNATAANPALTTFLGGSESLVGALAGVNREGLSFVGTMGQIAAAVKTFDEDTENAKGFFDHVAEFANSAKDAMLEFVGAANSAQTAFKSGDEYFSHLMVGNGPGPQHDGYAAGGTVGGSGFGDTVPAMLTPGEFVVKKKVAESLRPFLVQLNNGNLGGAHVLWNTLLANTRVKGMSLLGDILGIERKQIGNFGFGVNMATVGHQNEMLAKIASGMLGTINTLKLGGGGTVPQRFASGGSVGGGSSITKSTTINGGVSLNMGGQQMSKGFVRRVLIPELERLGDRGQSRRGRTGR